jgi:hypothetical protein
VYATEAAYNKPCVWIGLKCLVCPFWAAAPRHQAVIQQSRRSFIQYKTGVKTEITSQPPSQEGQIVFFENPISNEFVITDAVLPF